MDKEVGRTKTVEKSLKLYKYDDAHVLIGR